MPVNAAGFLITTAKIIPTDRNLLPARTNATPLYIAVSSKAVTLQNFQFPELLAFQTKHTARFSGMRRRVYKRRFYFFHFLFLNIFTSYVHRKIWGGTWMLTLKILPRLSITFP